MMNENNDKLFKSINEFGALLNAVKTSSPAEEKAKKIKQSIRKKSYGAGRKVFLR